MSKLNMKEWINEIIQKKEVVAMPIMTHPGIEMIGKTVRDAVTDGQVHYNAIKALSEKYPTAAATVIMDNFVYPLFHIQFTHGLFILYLFCYCKSKSFL